MKSPRLSKTQQAIALIGQGMAVADAARQVNISTQAVHLAIKQKECEEANICPCCYQPLPETNRQ